MGPAGCFAETGAETNDKEEHMAHCGPLLFILLRFNSQLAVNCIVIVH